MNTDEKIVSVDKLLSEIGHYPRKKTVVMCHGTFDIVHPGHIRHLRYAKSKADILIASLTSDEFINKGTYKPYVPEALRASNLASLHLVDYVIVDGSAKPLDNIEIIKPDYFAKGYEYQSGPLNSRTQEEIAVLDRYGGNILYTPGDVVYSSTSLMEQEQPQLKYEKLISLMESEGISFQQIKQSLLGLGGQHVHIIGDTIVDRQTQCAPYGSGNKTPTLSVRFESKADFVGGAAIVALHLKAAGSDVVFSTVLGEDAPGSFVKKELERAGISVQSIEEPGRPTTLKNAVIVQGYRLLKIDSVENKPITEKVSQFICSSIKSNPADVVIFSDFKHGIFTKNNIEYFRDNIPSGAFKAADSQVATRWGNILDFRGFDLITPNEKEARFSLGDQDSVIRPLAKKLYEKANCETLILKCGERGVITYLKKDDDYRAFFSMDSFAEKIVDPVGAGDALLAYSSLVLSKYNSPIIAAIIGNIAAGIECEFDGNIPIEVPMLIERINQIEKHCNYEF